MRWPSFFRRLCPMLTFRAATPADLPSLATFVNRAYRGDSARKGWTHEADLLGGTRVDETLLAEQIATPNVTLIVSLENTELVGCYHFERRGDGSAYVGMVTVDPDRQATGLGKQLLADAEVRARAAGASILKLSVIADRKELIAYYERRGFRATGVELPFHEGDERYGLPHKPLALLEMAKNL